jgi:hypothetical protein
MSGYQRFGVNAGNGVASFLKGVLTVMKFLKILQLIVTLLPTLAAAVEAVEKILPASDQGTQKLAMVRDILESTYKAAGDVSIAFDQVWPAISGTVDALVFAFNKSGIFQSKQSESE